MTGTVQRRAFATGALGTALVAACVIMAALTVAASLLAAYWADPAALWRDPYHDRNTHYLNGLNLALDLVALDPAGFLADATADPIWPPFHAVALAAVLAVGGLDHRLAILPSLAGWCATIVLTWLIARRAAPAGVPGWFPGAVAAALALASPAFQLLGSDVMLEGLGAALGAMTLYASMRCDATPSGARWVRPLAILLTLLFLEKFNYWLLVLAALAVTLAWGGRRRLIAMAARAELFRLVGRVILSPPGLLGALALMAAIALSITGPQPVTALGRGFLVFPGLVLTAAYGILLLRACQVWRRERAALRAALDPAALTMLRWHVLPVALWFLAPQALTRFLWFIGPAHRGASTGYDPWRALQFQWTGFSEGFHSPVIAAPALVLALLGGAHLARRAGGGRCVAVFAALSAIVLVLHPQQQWRFQATMLFAVWVCAGAGAGLVLAAAARAARAPATLPAVVLAASLVLLAWQPPATLAQLAAIRTPDAPSDLSLAAAYLPLLGGARSIGVATTFGVSDLFAWTVREACRCRVAVDQPWVQMAATRAEAAALTASWLDRLPADRVLLIDGPAPYALPGRPALRETLAGARDALQEQPRLTPLLDTPLRVGRNKIMSWRANAPPPLPPPSRLRLDAMMSAAFAGLVAAILLWPGSRRRAG